MVYLNIEDDNQDLYGFINSSAGWVIPRIVFYDTVILYFGRRRHYQMSSISSCLAPMSFFFFKKKTMPSPYEY
ncbi:hypothetical protein Lal_00012411 [Lupinus albus]|nr:hypothetical protein Lal_00012411 [Lupinus albus]